MSSVFFEIRKDHFVRSELIKAFFKESTIIAAFPKIEYKDNFCFVVEGEKEPLITTEECFNSYIELLKRNDKLKRSFEQ